MQDTLDCLRCTVAPPKSDSSGASWHPLPDWSRYLIQLGSFAAECHPEGRFRLGVSLPTRAFAAPLVSFGIGLQRSLNPTEHTAGAAHMDALRQLTHGAALYVYEDDRRKKGVLEISVEDGEQVFWVRISAQPGRTTSGGTRLMLTPSVASRVAPADVETWGRDLPRNQKGRVLSKHSAFARAVLNTNAEQYCRFSRRESLIVGVSKLIREECEHEFLAHTRPEDGKCLRGALDDIVRLRPLADGATPFRTDLVPQAAKSPVNVVRDLDNCPIIFDGAAAFLKCRGAYRAANWIVLLDRSDPLFADAIMQFNREYVAARRSPLVIGDTLATPPPSTEVTAYEEF